MRFIDREVARSLKQPVSVRNAMAVIVTATVVTVVLGGILISLLDAKDFPDIFIGMWWALQTVTTVGYGDVTPKEPIGRAIGAVVMIESIAFLSVITAAVTSSFVERTRQQRRAQEAAQDAEEAEQLESRLATIADQLARIERALDEIRSETNTVR